MTNINLEAEVEDFKERCREWFRVDATAENAPKFRDLIAMAGEIEKKIEARRKAEKQPHMDAGKAIDTAHAALVSPVSTARDYLKKALGKFMLAEEQRRREEADRARREAEEARKAAEVEQDPFVAFDAKQAETVAKDAAKAARAPVNVSGVEASRAAGLRTYWLIDVSDGAALVQHFASSPHMIEEARKLAAAQVRAAKGGDCGIPGITITEDKRVT